MGPTTKRRVEHESWRRRSTVGRIAKRGRLENATIGETTIESVVLRGTTLLAPTETFAEGATTLPDAGVAVAVLTTKVTNGNDRERTTPRAAAADQNGSGRTPRTNPARRIGLIERVVVCSLTGMWTTIAMPAVEQIAPTETLIIATVLVARVIVNGGLNLAQDHLDDIPTPILPPINPTVRHIATLRRLVVQNFSPDSNPLVDNIPSTINDRSMILAQISMRRNAPVITTLHTDNRIHDPIFDQSNPFLFLVQPKLEDSTVLPVRRYPTSSATTPENRSRS